MKFHNLLFMVSISLAPSVFAQDKPDPTDVDGNIQWVFDLEEGQQLSQETDKPMFIVFRCER